MNHETLKFNPKTKYATILTIFLPNGIKKYFRLSEKTIAFLFSSSEKSVTIEEASGALTSFQNISYILETN